MWWYLSTCDSNLSLNFVGDVKAGGGDGDDYFEVGDTMTSYVVNAGVDVDGGTGKELR